MGQWLVVNGSGGLADDTFGFFGEIFGRYKFILYFCRRIDYLIVKKRMRKKNILLMMLSVCLMGLTACEPQGKGLVLTTKASEISGKETVAKAGENNKKKKLALTNIVKGQPADDMLLQHTGFVASYNTKMGTPSWVAWELTRSETDGDVSRKDYKFLPDPLLPKRYQVVHADYTGSGYDRGHMCPAGDMQWSDAAMRDCHYMTNICPQVPKLNQVYWERLESACRRWADIYGSVYVVCGPVYKGKRHAGIGGKHTVKVPEGFFKVVVMLKSGKEKGIGFYYANSEKHQTMEDAAMTIDEVESMTGYDFFAALPDNIEKKVEAQNDLNGWQ